MFDFIKKSITVKIMMLILLVTGLITVVLISLSAQLSNNFLSQLLNEQGARTINSYVVTVNQWFEEREDDITDYANSPLVRKLDWRDMEEYLKREQQKHKQIYNLFFAADREGNFYSTADKTGNINDRAYFHEVLEGRSVISEPVVSKVSGEDIIVVAAPIKNNGTITGLMGATIKLDILADYINDFRLDYPDSSSFIINKNGDMITYPDNKMIMKENIFKVSSTIDENLADAARVIKTRNKGSFIYNNNGREMLVYYQRISGLPGWFFVARVSESFVNNYIYNAVIRLLILGVLGIILAMTLSYLISRSISNPIINLKKVFNQAADGDLEVRAEIERVDEIGQAADAFNKMMNTLNHVTYYDNRTGLPNRRYLDETLRVLCNHARSNQEKFAVITLEVDQYNRIIDLKGHSSGDILLSSIAKSLLEISDDIKVFSWIDGQIVILLTEIRYIQDIFHYIRKISLNINKKWSIENSDFFISSSMGVAIYPENGEDSETLLKNASLALHRTLESAESFYQFYNPEMNESLIADISIDNALRLALENEEFELYYQPQYDIKSENIVGMEALIRWIHPEKGIISPASFIPIAEENGLIIEIGRWVIAEACRQAAEWNKRAAKPYKIAVNISTSQLMQDDFVEIVQEILLKTGLKPELLELEITERAMVSNIKKIIMILNTLKEMGINIAVDDFGTGYSSLQYLKDFSLNNLKIDMSFIQQLFDNEKNKGIVSAIISMGHSLELEVTAEGIDDIKQLNFLRDNKCDFIQGYYYSKPLPVSKLEELLKI